MNNSISQMRNAYKVQIRRKRVQDKIAQLRSAHMQKYESDNNQHYTDDKITKLVKQTLQSEQKMIENLSLVKTASFYLNQKNVHLFFPLVKDFCFILAHLEGIIFQQYIRDIKSNKQTSLNNKDIVYNDIITILINISSNQNYQWPSDEYLPIIKNLLIPSREINTMWLLSNILYQRHNPSTQHFLTRQLIKYDCITYCSQRLDKKFNNDQDINVFCCFVSSFLSNSTYLSLEQFKRIMKVLQTLSSLHSQSIDWFIADSMIDHAPDITKKNYQMLHSTIINNLKQRYIKKKKTKIILKFLEFTKLYVLSEIHDNIDQQNNNNKIEIKDDKLAKFNYQRISLMILPILALCVYNLSPEVKANLMQITCILLQFYFPFIDLENQSIYLTLAEGLNKNALSILSKYSNKALYWQLKLVHVLFNKIKQYKISKEIISSFMEENNIMEAFVVILKEKSEVIEIVEEITQLLMVLMSQVEWKNVGEKFSYHINQLKQSLELILNNFQVKDDNLYKKIDYVIKLSEETI